MTEIASPVPDMRILDALAAFGLLAPTGKPISDLPAHLAGKRVGLYFSAGWCPMCTNFEPALMKFRDDCAQNDAPIELLYVPSDRSAADALKRAKALDCAMVPFEHADSMKKQYKVWAGSEAMKLGLGRRSGVPAIVVVGPDDGSELAFVDAERRGPQALQKWDLSSGVF